MNAANPNAALLYFTTMGRIVVYTYPNCPYSSRVKMVLEKKQVPYVEVDVEQHPKQREKLKLFHGVTAFPQVFFNHEHIGEKLTLARFNHVKVVLSSFSNWRIRES